MVEFKKSVICYEKLFLFWGGGGYKHIFSMVFTYVDEFIVLKSYEQFFLNVKLISVVDVPVNGYVIPQGSRVFANLYQVVLNSVLILLSILLRILLNHFYCRLCTTLRFFRTRKRSILTGKNHAKPSQNHRRAHCHSHSCSTNFAIQGASHC